MTTIAEIRQQYPQYSDMSDSDFAGAFHKKFYADMPREEFDKKLGVTPDDPYKARAQKEFDELKARGVPVEMRTSRRLAQGLTFNTADEILAGLSTPFEMIKRGTLNPIEGYRSAKAAEDVALEDSRKNGGIAGSIAEIGGGVMGGAGLANGGVTAARLLPNAPGILARSLASAADGVAMGGVGGFMDGSGAQDRAEKGAQGAALGGLLGGIVPPVLAIGSAALSPITSNIRARINPEGFARTQVARGVVESGQTPQQLAHAVEQAGAEGQGMFALADAMGNSGQRMLATTARSPGQARTDVINFLDNRQAGQGRRIVGALSDGFDSPDTAQRLVERLTAQRGADADAAYSAVRAGAGRTDVVPAINQIDRTIGTGPGQTLQAANDSVEGALRPFRERLARVNPDDFEAVQRIRFDMADAAQNARQSGYGNRAREIGNAVRQLDAAMEQASTGYRQANRNFAQASRDIEAVDLGRNAAMRGRTEDIIPEFRGLTARGQEAYRTGYVDPLIQHTQGAAFGANKARPLINDAFASESAAIAPMRNQALMQRRIGREDTMFQTRNAAVGGSKTAENMNDDAAMGIDPSLIMNVLSGNVGGALKSVMSAVGNGWNGNTAGVREEVARILLQRGQNVNPQAIQHLLDETVRRIETVTQIARQLGRGASGGVAVAPGATGQRR